MGLVISDTPWDRYKVDGVLVHVKREDLCCPEPGPSFSKIRGVQAHLEWLIIARGKVPVGVLDTVHSKAGWGVAYLCQQMGLECYNFFPVYKHEWVVDGFIPRQNQINANALGAQLVPMTAGRSAILHHKATRALLDNTGGKGYMMPNALKLPESVKATARELMDYTPANLLAGTWVVSASSGTLAAGVLLGLCDAMGGVVTNTLIIHMGYSRPRQAVLDYVYRASGVAAKADICVVDEGYEYKDKVEAECPFPCNEYYDLKAWKWLQTHAHNLEQPIVFWNIGA